MRSAEARLPIGMILQATGMMVAVVVPGGFGRALGTEEEHAAATAAAGTY